ncbi:MAG: DUF6502 family protein [Steroidobacteraceae bacterium]
MNSKIQDGDGISQSARILLRRVFRILRGCRLTDAQLRVLATEAVDEIAQIPDSLPSRVTARQGLMCCDVVLRWRRDCSFLDSTGLPAQLSMEQSSPSFVELVGTAAPGADPKLLLATMEELGVVRIAENRKIELISDSVVACSGQEGTSIASECVLEHICGFLGSVEFNVFDKPSRAKGRFERACYASVPRDLVPIIQQLVSTRGQDFVDVIDEWLARRAIRTENNQESLLLGAGAYIFVRENIA